MKYNFPKLRAPVKRKWLKALRSGKYKQGFGYLSPDEGEFCCIGVLCEVLEVQYNPLSAYPPDRTAFRAFLKHDDVVDVVPVVYRTLAGFNDQSSWSFKKIANWIEKHL